MCPGFLSTRRSLLSTRYQPPIDNSSSFNSSFNSVPAHGFGCDVHVLDLTSDTSASTPGIYRPAFLPSLVVPLPRLLLLFLPSLVILLFRQSSPNAHCRQVPTELDLCCNIRSCRNCTVFPHRICIVNFGHKLCKTVTLLMIPLSSPSCREASIVLT